MAHSTHLVVFCALAIVWQTVDMFGLSAGPYKVKIKQLETCADEGTGQMHFGSKISRASNGEHIYNSTVKFGVPFDENIKMHLELQQFGNGGYKPRSIENTFKNCEDMWHYLKDFITNLLKSAGVNITKCPIPEGNYTANNFELDNQKVNNMPVLVYNQYKAIANFYYKEVKVGCEIFYVDIVAN